MSLQITKIRGIPIRLHFTLLITFLLISWTIAVRFTPQIYPGLTSLEYWITGITGAVVLFSSVVLHELAHSLLAMKYGLHVREIILFIFGGVSNIEDLDVTGERKGTVHDGILADFRKEIRIALAGPITSFAIAAVLALILFLLSRVSLQSDFALYKIVDVVLIYGTIVNILLGIFNLIPAFPLDGGRILRASILNWKKDYEKATKIAVRVGVIISYAFMGSGFIIMLLGDFFAGIWILLIGWFLNNGAQSYMSQYQLSSILSRVHLRDIMNTNIIFVKDTFTIKEALSEYFNRHAKDSFPVLDDQRHLLGIVTFKDASNILESSRDYVLVKDVMIPVTDLIIMQQNGAADEALMKMVRRPTRRIFVCDAERKLVGIVNKTDIMNIATAKKEIMKNKK
jgi:Zn-dependent protease/predicted transcriptional regulator